jgi:cysteine desulfuration protein SufE
MSALPSSLNRVVQKFQRLSEVRQRYEQLLWFAKRLETFPEEAKTADHRVPGCASQVYIVTALESGKVRFQGDADSQLIKGLVAFLIEGLNGLTPAEVLQITPDFIQDTGLNVSLTPSRVNGFHNIFQMMQQQTLALSPGFQVNPSLN